MTTTVDPGKLPSVPGVMNYLDSSSTVLRRFTAPGDSVNTGTYEAHEVPVYNGRPVQDAFDFDVHGFEILERPSAVQDFTDKDEMDRVYLPEVEKFVRERTGADEVVVRGWTLRRAEAPKENNSQPAAGLVHVDFAPEGAEDRAEIIYRKQFPDGPGFSRVLTTSFWRVFSPAPQDWPLALCDFNSVDPSEGLPNQLYFVDQIPEDPFGSVEGMTNEVSGSEFHYRPEHKWYYFPDMNRDEALFFKLNDTDHSHAWRVVHSAFYDQTVKALEPRHSVEVRTYAFFH